MTLIEAAKQALEALYMANTRELPENKIGAAINALSAAIAEAEKQEPVACIIDGDLYYHHEIDWEDLAYQGNGVELLYTTPPRREWVGLTDEEVKSLPQWFPSHETAAVLPLIRAIEAKLREKNA